MELVPGYSLFKSCAATRKILQNSPGISAKGLVLQVKKEHYLYIDSVNGITLQSAIRSPTQTTGRLLNFIVADDHALIRESLRAQLNKLTTNATIYEASNAKEVIQLLSQRQDIDLLLLDLYMPDCQGAELVSTLCDRFPETPVVVISGSDSMEDMRKSIDCGAAGFIPKSTAKEVMLSAIQLVLAGGIYIPECMVRNPQEKPANIPRNHLDATPKPGSNSDAICNRLTPRQIEALTLICKGLPNKLIAREMGISIYTVKVHVAAILRALGKDNRTAVAMVAEQQGLCTKHQEPPGEN
ncbi:MAG TPA: response regulator transcription factor [Gammaproteobacteria bacterium]|nr:response regulator transcription factor [Gammaproteobacteria bacterium]